MAETCKLCGEESELINSHIIPKFVFRWMQETGGKFFRAPISPNIRKQDGFKQKLLCKKCEVSLSTSEKWFSENVFRPYLETHNNVLQYTPDMARFIISVLWRILLTSDNIVCKETNVLSLKLVIKDWKDYLLRENSQPKFKNIHLIFIPDKFGMNSQPNKYISRYFSRVSDGGIIEMENSFIVFAKLASFILFGEISNNEINFRGTEISMDSGVTMPNQFIVNNEISDYFINRAQEVYKIMENSISRNQQNIINTEIIKTLNDLQNSELWSVIKNDVEAEINPNGYHYVFNYNCDCCNSLLEAPEGFLLRTFEVVKSYEFWKNLFSINKIGTNEKGVETRIEYFKMVASDTSPWVFCNNCISKFKIDLEEHKGYMQNWINNKGNYYPPKSDDIRKYITEEEIDMIAYTIVTI